MTDGSRLPFRIRPGAATSSVDVGTSAVGVFTASPVQDLHVADGGDANTNTAIRMSTTSHAWDFATIDSNGSCRTSKEGTGVTELDLSAAGNLNAITGQLVTGGPQCGAATPCDHVFAPDYEVESIEEHAALMWANSYLPAVGPTEPGAPMNLSKKTGRILNEFEKAQVYIEQLYTTIQELKAESGQKDEFLLALQERVARLEASRDKH